jgi:RNA polymerase sigma-70 factor, ECF subfamily
MSSPDDGDAEDRALLAAHVGGDPRAFTTLVQRHQTRLWAVALRTLGDREEAADALQDALLSAYRSAGSYRGDARVTTWLHRVVVNACLDRLRAAKVRRAEALPDDLDERSGRGSVLTASGPGDDPEQAAIADDRRRAVLEALATLPAEQRAALVLVDMEGYPVAEVAAMLDCAEGTVKSRCSRGRDRLATLLRDRLGEQPGAPPTPRDRGHPEPDPPPARPITAPPHPTTTREGGGT